MARSETGTSSGELPLRERLPEYLALFGTGIAACLVAAALVALISDYTFAGSFGYFLIGIGTIMLLAGGVSGGGYANLGVGAIGTMFGSGVRNPEGTADDDDPEELRREVFGKHRDPRERLRRGLRPEANPRAFWQVIGGAIYFTLGTVIVIRFVS